MLLLPQQLAYDLPLVMPVISCEGRVAVAVAPGTVHWRLGRGREEWAALVKQ